MHEISLNVQQLCSLLPLLSVQVIPESHSEVVPETSGIQNTVFRGIPEISELESSVFSWRRQKLSKNASLAPSVINKTKQDIPEIIAEISEPAPEADITLNQRCIKESLKFVRNIIVNETQRDNWNSNELSVSVNAIIRSASEAVATLQAKNSVNEQLRHKARLMPSHQHNKFVFGNVCLLSGGRH